MQNGWLSVIINFNICNLHNKLLHVLQIVPINVCSYFSFFFNFYISLLYYLAFDINIKLREYSYKNDMQHANLIIIFIIFSYFLPQ